MGLIAAIVIAIGSLLLSAIALFASGMSDSPSTVVSPWPPLYIGLPLAAFLAITHYFPVSW